MLKFIKKDKQSKRFCYQLESISFFNLLLEWAQQFNTISYLQSNDYYKNNLSLFSYHKYDFVLAFNNTENAKTECFKYNQLALYLKNVKDWLFGYFSYDLKEELFNLQTDNKDYLLFDKLYFFRPDIVVTSLNNKIILEARMDIDIPSFILDVESYSSNNSIRRQNVKFKSRVSKQNYIESVNSIKSQIQYGNIYEMNYCQEFFDDNSEINAWQTYKKLNSISPTPFSAYFKQSNRYLLSASPERFITKVKNKIISQPIKGTIKKTDNPTENLTLIKDLKNNPKEQAENVMIVDLVRNDLSQIAKKGSVKVEELFGIYPFKQLYQMISTISAEKSERSSSVDVIKTNFPMGSMTGAPKLSAMKFIDKYEITKRGLYSGSVGYFSPSGEFDFNVVIRSLLYNESNKYLSYTVGSAITIQSDAELEYEECLLKAKAINDTFKP